MSKRRGRASRSAVLGAVLIAAGAWGAAQSPAPPGLVAAWDFEEASGTTVRDSSPNRFDGLVRGNAQRVAGPSGQALAFDGTAWVEVPVHGELLLGSGLTIQASFLATDVRPDTYKHLVDVGDSYLLRLDNPAEGGKLSFFTFLEKNPEPRLQAGVPSTQTWHRVFAVWNGATMQLWLDGRKRESARTGKPAPTAQPLAIGRSFIGAIDQVRIYNRALSEAEIRGFEPPVARVALTAPRPVFEVGRPFEVTCEISNDGGQSLESGTVQLALPPGLRLLEGTNPALLPSVPWGRSQILRWRLQADAGTAAMCEAMARFDGLPEVRARAPVVVARAIPAYELEFSQPRLVGRGKDLVLGNSRVRLVFPWDDFGYGVYAVEANHRGRWKRLALANGFGLLAVKGPAGPAAQFVPCRRHAPLVTAEGGTGVVFEDGWVDAAGARWQGRFSFRLGQDDRVNVVSEMVPDRNGELVAFQGPTLYAGEGSFGAAKDDALFGGIEWLVGNEVSSSNLDMHDPDYYLRYVPHPNKIAVPLMALTHEQTGLALYWDCLQRWDGTNTRPSAVFASPNVLDGQSNHLLGLFLPSVPEWVPPNERWASARPYPFKAGVPLRLEAWIACPSPASDTMACLARWFDTFGVPKPAPLPRGSYRGEIEFSMRAFLESLWVPAEQKWWSSKGAGELLSVKGLPAGFAWQLRLGALLTGDPALRQSCLDRAALAERLGNFQAAWDDLGFTYGDPTAALAALSQQALGMLDTMGPDGAWRFRTRVETQGVFKGMDYGQLGPDNAAELGTCARNAYEILRYCRLTGDADTFAAVEPALRFMEQFKVPRAAQVWECPVHAPDILAAADAIEAYLEAYRFSGDRRYLERATGWAWRGLPFLYVWNPPDRPMLRYASIAILGGSWHAGSWIGQPVQWNGLRYAYALLKLAEADSSFPWKPVAEGVTVSALHQQDESDPNAALWPDNFSAIDGSKCAWVFEPGLILKNVFRLLDHEVEPSTTVLGSGTERVFVSSRARISEGAWAPPTLRFQASFPPGESGSVVVGHVTRPATVSVNGVPAASLSSPLQQAAGNAWRHETDSGLLTLRLGSTGPHSVEVAGVRYEPAGLAPPALDRIAFDFATGREGWQAAHEVEDLRAEDGLLKGTATGGDPYLHRLRLRVGGRLSDQVAVRARVSSGEGLALFWITRESPRWGEDKVLRLPLRPGSALEEYVFEAGKHGEWAGRQITGLRLDPLEGPSGGTFEIDSIRLR